MSIDTAARYDLESHLYLRMLKDSNYVGDLSVNPLLIDCEKLVRELADLAGNTKNLTKIFDA